MSSLPVLLGVDFSSAPTAAKPVMVAAARLTETAGKPHCDVLSLFSFKRLIDFQSFLETSPPWVAAIDMPFGLSRELIEVLRWPHRDDSGVVSWDAWARFYTSLQRTEIREVFKAWCDAHPPGQKFAHRATDRPAKSSPSMKWVNPPVAYMLHAGAELLLKLDANIIGQRPQGRSDRIALEAYPGYLARQLLSGQSYKHDDATRQTSAREAARAHLIEQVNVGFEGLSVSLHPDIQTAMLTDGKGDALDAVLCVLQAAMAWSRDTGRFDLPPDIDPLEGWIVNVPWQQTPRQVPACDEGAALSLRTQVYGAVSRTTRQRLRDLGAGVPEDLLL